ncbi:MULTISPECIES: stage II sporulation protein M [Kyrpidia]|uniref:Stage II sporulation protein M n=2 Tax=Kyrpidia spormannii TaxID=2055160 RepID=A0A6F9E8U2_9BACL|nr:MULTISPECIES: stage II sporulation protein M [Kyrpidia]MCL6575738.1 stage II sporulation protein M [Kyrpidia sp.]CAB3392832.1 Stage II sporulation protein M [Kyrpidia spormannii]CAB3393744.1 Stage II sporulation protein M [Kyrpidia spormannii]
MKSRWRQAADLHLQTRSGLYRFVAVLFLVGVFFGAIIEGSLGPSQKQLLADEVGSFLTMLTAGQGAAPGDVVRHAAAVNLRWVAFIWIFGLSIIGLPLIVGMVFLKGFVIGFSVAFFVEKYAWPGFVVSMAGMLPQNLLTVPALMACATAGIAFSLELIRVGFARQGRGQLADHLRGYSLLVMMMAGVALVAAGVEGLVSARLMTLAVSRLIH